MNASVTKKGKTTKFYHKVNKLPGEIDPEKCQIEVFINSVDYFH